MAPETPPSAGEPVKPAAARIYVMPEQFLAVTRGAGLPVAKAPPPPVAAAVQQGKAAAAPAPPKPAPTPPSATPTPTPQASSLKPQASPSGPGIPMEEGKRKMIMVWGGVAAVILIGGGLAAFFALRSVKPPAPPAPPAPRNVAPANIPAPAPVNVPPVPEPEPEPAPPPPAPDRDTDEDGLTDAEELLLGTDIGLADSDGDSYSDAQELANLYNPAGVAPQRLLDAGLVYAYEHPTQGWSIYLPRQWSIAATDQEQEEVIITTEAAGEDVVIRTRELSSPGLVSCLGGCERIVTKRGAGGYRGLGASGGDAASPSAVTFQISGRQLVVFEHRTASPPSRYPHAVEMIIQSYAAPAPQLGP